MFNKLVVFFTVLLCILLGNCAYSQQVMLQLVSGNPTDKRSNSDYVLIFEINGKKVEIDKYNLLNNIALQTNIENGYKIINKDITGDGINDYLVSIQFSRGCDFFHAVNGESLKTIYSHGWNKSFKEPNICMNIKYKYKLHEITFEVIYADAPEQGKSDEYLKWKNAHFVKYIWSDKEQKFVKVYYKNYSTIQYNKVLRNRMQGP